MMMIMLMAAGFAAATPAVVQDVDAPRVSVHYGDLNLASERGQRTLETRIARARRELCTPPNPTSLVRLPMNKECVATVDRVALPQMEAAIATSVRMAGVSTMTAAATAIIAK